MEEGGACKKIETVWNNNNTIAATVSRLWLGSRSNWSWGECCCSSLTRHEHDKSNPSDGNNTTDEVPAVRSLAIQSPVPQKRQRDEEPTVCGIDPTEHLVLQRGYKSIQH